jgi:CRISPR/Cas system-associated exonuclease Cas4 (RecB family)
MPLVTIADLNRDPDEIAPWFEHAKNLSALYDRYVNTEDEESERAAGIHASEVAGCPRKLYYTAKGETKRPVVSRFWRQRFKVGHAIHAMVQRDFKRMARRTFVLPAARAMARELGLFLEFEHETPVAPKYQALAARLNIHSSCDGVFTFRESLHGPAALRVGVEVKTDSPGAYEKRKKPDPDHVEQAHVYMACLDLPLMWFFYFCKGTQNNTPSQAPFLIPFNPAVWSAIETRCGEVLARVARSDPPAREESIVCEFCPYAWTCQPRSLDKSARGAPAQLLTFGGRRP